MKPHTGTIPLKSAGRTQGDAKAMWVMAGLLGIMAEVLVIGVRLVPSVRHPSIHTLSAIALVIGSIAPWTSGRRVEKQFARNRDITEQSRIDLSYQLGSLVMFSYLLLELALIAFS